MTANHAHTPSKNQVGYSYVQANAAKAPDHQLWDEFHEFIAQVEAAAEQRGAEAALICENETSMEHHEQTDNFPCTRCLTRAQEMIDHYRDQMEGDDA